jgi:hypothetical protein
MRGIISAAPMSVKTKGPPLHRLVQGWLPVMPTILSFIPLPCAIAGAGASP